MFVDYYALLEISPISDSDQIKSAFKKQALRYHPDRNPDKDTTRIMQLLNEAKLILLDQEARARYDIEYARFHSRFKSSETGNSNNNQKSSTQKEQAGETHQYDDYTVNDDILERWIKNARKQAVDLAAQTIKDLKGMVAAGAKAAVKETGNQIVIQIVIGVVVLAIFGISRTCSKSTSSPKPSKYIAPDTIQIDTSYKAGRFFSYKTSNGALIQVSEKMELQDQQYKKLIKKYVSALKRNIDYEVQGDRVVFQQRGLNKRNKDAFNDYARIIIETETVENRGEFFNGDSAKITKEDMAELEKSTKEILVEAFRNTEMKLLNWKGVNLVLLNGHPAIKISFQRQLGSNPVVNVNSYAFQRGNVLLRLTFSYREEDYKMWEPRFTKSLMSFQLYD